MPANWTAIGPAPQHDPNAIARTIAKEDVTGRITALALATVNGATKALFVGAAGGGIWRSTDYTNVNRSWSPTWDNLGRACRGLGRLVRNAESGRIFVRLTIGGSSRLLTPLAAGRKGRGLLNIRRMRRARAQARTRC